MTAIATLAEFYAYLGLENAGDPAILQGALDTAQQQVEAYCGRNFDTASGTATDRVFTPRDGMHLYIDDLADTTGLVVKNYGSTVVPQFYQLEPLNNLGDDRRYRPYTQIRLLAPAWIMINQRATVTVTGNWGWTGGAPATVKQAVLDIAKDNVGMRAARFGVADFGEFGVRTIRDNGAVLSRLRSFVRGDRLGIA